MTTKEAILLAIKKDQLKELFVETIADKPQIQVPIKEIYDCSEDDFIAVFKKMGNEDLLCTNNTYKEDLTQYQIWQKDGTCVIEVMKDTFDHHNPEDYVQNEDLLDGLVRKYEVLLDADKVFVLKQVS